MSGLKVMGAVLALLAVAAAQQPTANEQESLDQAWWTGPMLAPSASTLPRGHYLLEPYFYNVSTQGFFDAQGNRISAPHENSFGSLTYALYGIVNKLTVGLIPTVGYNQVSNGPDSSGIELGDLTVQAQYRLHLFEKGKWLPTTAIAFQETLPTGKYDHLGNRPSDALGTGAFTTAIALYTQAFLWMPNGRIMRLRFNVVPGFSRSVNVEDASVYGTTTGFRGQAKPGASVLVDVAAEYSMTRRWVLALDATYRGQRNTRVTGHNLTDPLASLSFNSGSSIAFGLAPAIEYNLRSNLGVLLGVRLFPAGRNTPLTITPAIAVNYVH